MSGITSLAQDSSFNAYINLNKITVAKSMAGSVSSVFVNPSFELQKEYNKLKFEPKVKFKGLIPDKYVTKKLLLKFNIQNTADTISSIYFFPGFYYTVLRLTRYRMCCQIIRIVLATDLLH